MQDNLTQRGNMGETGGIPRPVEGQPIPETTYVNDGFQVSSFYLPVGIGLLLVVAVVVTFVLTKRKFDKR